MTPEQMLEELDARGMDAFGDYDDENDGWFGWSVKDGLLTITWQPTDDNGCGLAPVQAQWTVSSKDEAPVILKFNRELTEEDVAQIRRSFLQHYHNRGMRPFDERR